MRRRIFVAALSLFAIATASASWAFELDTPEGQLQAYRRIQCSVNDGEVVVYWWLTSAVPLFYENPLGGDYQEYVGGTYHATEMFNLMGDVASLTDDDINTADVGVGWVRLSSWLPWMEMGDRPGIL